MYYILYPFLYVLSLLPWRVLYLISDGIYAVIYYLIGYRKQVVMHNLSIAFPEKTEEERVRIAKDFYRNLTDTIMETIKLLSLSERSLVKRYETESGIVDKYYASGKNVQYHSGHFFNLEFINLAESRLGKFPFVVVYMPIASKAFNRIIYNLRTRYGSIMIPATAFKTSFHKYIKGRYALALAADQNPGNPNKAHWLPFFGKLAPFTTGPEKGAKRNDTLVFYANFYRVKRGYFKLEAELLAENPRDLAAGQLTRLFVQKLENSIRERPANYLWSHRRWKHAFDPDKHAHLRIDYAAWFFDTDHQKDMITRLADVPANIVAFEASGKVAKEDFEAVVMPAVSELVGRTGELNYLMEINTPLSEFTIGAWLQDLLLGIKQITKWNRVAILSDSEALNTFTDIFSVVVPGEYKGFKKEEISKAIEWTATGV